MSYKTQALLLLATVSLIALQLLLGPGVSEGM